MSKTPNDLQMGLFDPQAAIDNAMLRQRKHEEATRLRDDGIRRAAEHADRVNAEWQMRAFALFVEYCGTHTRFMTEEVRHWAINTLRIEPPPDGRAWGSVARRAVTSGWIVHDGYAEQKDPKAHRAPGGNVWRVTR